MISFKLHLLDKLKSNLQPITYIGQSNMPVLIFDFSFDFSDYLINKAPQYKFDWIPDRNFYLGIWAKVPKNFGTELTNFIQPYVDEYFFKNESQVSSV